MAAQKQDDQHEHTFSSYVRIQDVVLKTYLGRWTIGRSGERGSGISVLPARYDDDDFYRILIIISTFFNIFPLTTLKKKPRGIISLPENTLRMEDGKTFRIKLTTPIRKWDLHGEKVSYNKQLLVGSHLATDWTHTHTHTHCISMESKNCWHRPDIWMSISPWLEEGEMDSCLFQLL